MEKANDTISCTEVQYSLSELGANKVYDEACP